MKHLSIFILLCTCSLSADMYHHYLNDVKQEANIYEWEQETQTPFHELFITPNAMRPEKGHYTLYVSLKTHSWSPWMLYATWGTNFQKGTEVQYKDHAVCVDADAVLTDDTSFATGFRILVVAEQGATLKEFDGLHACVSPHERTFDANLQKRTKSIELSVEGLSQLLVSEEKGPRLCSPSSTLASVRFLSGVNSVDGLDFAMGSWDEHFDIFGNWVLNVANAYSYLPANSACWVERFTSVNQLIERLQKGFPTVISVRPPLPNSELPPEVRGHLITVKGYDAKTKEFLCMDPYSQTHETTHKRYHKDHLVTAWGLRGYVAYVFSNKTS